MEIAKQFLGSGYDVCGHYADAGSVKKKIFDLESTPEDCKRDMPNQRAYVYSFECKSANEYQQKLSAKAGVEGTYLLFSGSVESSFDMLHLSTKESSFVITELYQCYKTCKLQTREHKYIYPDVLEDFNIQEGKWLIEQYGGCVLMGMDVGGRWTDSLTVSKLFANSTLEISIKMKKAYSKIMSGSSDANVSLIAKDEKSVVTRKVRVIGGDPSKAPDKLEEWKLSVKENLNLMNFTDDGLVPVWKIFPQHEEKLKKGFEEYVIEHQLELEEKSILETTIVDGYKLNSFDRHGNLELYEPPRSSESMWKYVGHNGNSSKILMLKEKVEGYGAICQPLGWHLVWNNRHRVIDTPPGPRVVVFDRVTDALIKAGMNAKFVFEVGYTSCWIPIAPPDYVALGAFCRIGRWMGKYPPTQKEAEGVVVVHRSFVTKCNVGRTIYNTGKSPGYNLTLGELPHRTLWPLETDDPYAGHQLPTPYTLKPDYIPDSQ